MAKQLNFICGSCLKPFNSIRAVEDHAKKVHPNTRTFLYKRSKVAYQPPGYDTPSLAEIAVGAEIKRTMGEPLDELEGSLVE